MERYITAVQASFIAKSLTGLAERPGVVIDAGAGVGRHTTILSTYADRVIATEANASLVKALARTGSNVTAVLVSPGSRVLPVQDRSANCIICIQAADMAHEDWFHRECSRVLKPRGILILDLQNRHSWKGILARTQQHRYRAEFGAVYYSLSLDDLIRGLHGAGLRVEEALGFNWLPFSHASDSPLVGPLVKIESFLRLRRLARLSPWVILSVRRDG